MVKYFLYLLFICVLSHTTNGQSLVYRNNGRIFNSEGEKLTTKQVDVIMSRNILVHNYYTEGRTKKTMGNIFLYGGLGLIVSDLAIGLTKDAEYPTVLTYVGVPLLLISIPTKIGYSKKIKKSVDKFNEIYPEGYTTDSSTDLDLVLNSTGFGIKISLN